MAANVIVPPVKLAALSVALAVYWHPVDVAKAVGIAEPAGGFQQVQVNSVRFIMTVATYSWALSCLSAWFYMAMFLIFVQTMCWASFLAGESIFGEFADGYIDRQTERDYAELGAVITFGLLWFLVLFGGRAGSKDQYRRRLLAFYTKHNPDKIADIGKILKKYKGNEELLFTRLQRKYSVLSHTAVENAVDEIGADGDDEGDINAQEIIEEVEYIQPLKTSGDSEEDGAMEVMKPRVKSPADKPPSHPASPTTKPTSSGAIHTPSPPRSPSVSASATVRSAIEDARRAQEKRVQQRVAQLEARGKKK